MNHPSDLPYPTLCLVTELSLASGEALLDKVEKVLDGGVDAVQLRAKDLAAGRLLSLARSLRKITGQRALLFINDRIDVAIAANANGVQLAEAAICVEAARRLVGEEMLVGRSVHSVEGAVEAEAQGADFLVLGAIFASDSKPGVEPAGIGLLEEAASRVSIPILAIGGIDKNNAGQVIRSGGYGVAVIRSILASSNPEQAALEIKQSMSAAAAKSGNIKVER